MSLVQYSDSESEVESPPAKRLRHTQASNLPPLPPTFHDLYASSTRVSVQDDPALHGGRKRVIPHVEGNWPTHLYLEWYPSKQELTLLENLIPTPTEHKNGLKIHSLLYSDLGAQLPLHISLSRPIVLRTEQRIRFTDVLQKSIETSKISPFHVIPDSLTWAPNHERTRWFLVVHVQKPKNDSLNALLHLSNKALACFDQPPLYASRDSHLQDYSANFHISLAWTLTEPSVEDTRYLEEIDLNPLKDLRVRFDCVKLKIGNNVTSVPLSADL